MSSCSHKIQQKASFESKSNVHYNQLPQSEENVTLIKQQEAKLIDVPIPLDVEPLPDYFSEHVTKGDELSLGYMSPMSRDELILFYTQEMERLGWKKRGLAHTVETLLYFEKPGRFCAISLRPQNTKINLIIFVGKR